MDSTISDADSYWEVGKTTMHGEVLAKACTNQCPLSTGDIYWLPSTIHLFFDQRHGRKQVVQANLIIQGELDKQAISIGAGRG